MKISGYIIMILKNRIALITGASRGIGKEISKKFLLNGASIIICSKNKARIEKTKKELKNLNLNKDQFIKEYVVNLASEKETNLFCKEIISSYPALDILINCAGVHGPLGNIENYSMQNLRDTLEINLISPINICTHFLKEFKNKNYGKIINFSGGGATFPLPEMNAYSLSKVALVRFTENISTELKNYNIDINAIAPGAILTDMNKSILNAGPEKVGVNYYKELKEKFKKSSGDINIVTDLTLYLASKESDGISGKLISAVWDNWKNFDKFKNTLISTDIYNLRRILPEDREENL
tara:strand:+ start:15041 stop:15928 length:888 start_codon:yes stop_codon:yes gene_type:complete